MHIVCLDLEGELVPEIGIEFADPLMQQLGSPTPSSMPSTHSRA